MKSGQVAPYVELMVNRKAKRTEATAPVLCSVIPGDLPPVLIECMAGEVDVIIPKDTSAALVKLDLLKEAEHIPQG